MSEMNGDAALSEMTIRDLDHKLDRMRDELRTELRSYVDEHFVNRDMFETRITRLTFEVVREVSTKLSAMVKDAMHEVAIETVSAFMDSPDFTLRFNELLDARKDQDRKERVEDMRKAFGTLGRVVQFVNPVISLVLGLLAVWAIFIR